MPRVIARPEDGPSSPEFAVPLRWARGIKKLMATQTKRDKVWRTGPSGLGDPCEVCLAAGMAQVLPGAKKKVSRTSLSSWIGTQVHHAFECEDTLIGKLLRQHYPQLQQEIEVPCGEVPGYGPIQGNIDAYDPDPEFGGVVCDWKILGPTSFKRIKGKGIDLKYGYQRQIYAYGIDLLNDPAKPISWTINFIMLAGSGQPGFTDVLIDIDRYKPEMVEEAYERAGIIYNDYVLPGRTNELESDPDCYACSGRGDML